LSRKQQITDDTVLTVIKMLQGIGEFIRGDTSMSLKDKSIQMDVVLDTMRFLNNYEENVQVLNEHQRQKGDPRFRNSGDER